MSNSNTPERLNVPLRDKTGFFYPLTTFDQIIMPDGVSRFDGGVMVDRTNATIGPAPTINADTLKGNQIQDFVMKKDIPDVVMPYPREWLPGQFLTHDIYGNLLWQTPAQPRQLSLNVLKDQWLQQEDGSFTQFVFVEGFTSNTKCNHVSLNKANASIDNFDTLQQAWTKVYKADTVNNGILLTSYTGMPDIDFNILVEVV